MSRVRWIAEIGSNHNGDLKRAIALIDEAARAGATAVKFQDFTASSLFSPEALAAKPTLWNRNRLSVQASWWPDLFVRARMRNLQFGVTPFRGLKGLQALVDFWKVSSYQILDEALLIALAAQEKPVVVSTGAATMEECLSAREILGHEKTTFLHCVSAYPCPAGLANLKAIDAMQKELCTPIGWSDHTMDTEVLERAVWRWRASAVEFHFDLEDCLGSETEHSWTPSRIGEVIFRVEESYMPDALERTRPCDGDGKKVPQPIEEKERLWRGDPADGLRPLRAERSRLSPA